MAPWQCLNFLPEPQGQGALRETFPQVDGSFGLAAVRWPFAAFWAGLRVCAAPAALFGRGPALLPRHGRGRRVRLEFVLAGAGIQVMGLHLGQLAELLELVGQLPPGPRLYA